MEESEFITYEFTYCENFWNRCGKCASNICECGCNIFTMISYIIFSLIWCPLCFPLGFLEGSCSLPCSSDEEYNKYTPGKWDNNCIKKEYFNNNPTDICINLHKVSSNIGRNFGSLIHPYRFHRCINSIKDKPKTEVME